jgi:hypothetical protein
MTAEDWRPDRPRREMNLGIREEDASQLGGMGAGDRIFVWVPPEFVGMLEVTSVPALRGGAFAGVTVVEVRATRMFGVPSGEGVGPPARLEVLAEGARCARLSEDVATNLARLLEAASGKRRRERSWLPREPDPAPIGARRPRWVPESLRRIMGPSELRAYLYVAVDELVEDRVGLSISEWPWLDTRGRVRFVADTEPLMIGVPKEEFLVFVSDRRVVRARTRSDVTEADIGFRRRPLAIGDVFAVPTNALPPLEELEELEELEDREEHVEVERMAFNADAGPVYDVSGDAREAAKVALFGTVGEKLAPERARLIVEERPDPEDAPPEDATPPFPPPPFEEDH